jgi:hypothetical protein
MNTEPTGPSASGRDFLARLTGEPLARLESEPAALGRGLLALAHEATGLLRGYASEDPAVRQAAYRRWAELDAMLPKPELADPERSTGLSEANRVRLRAGLTKIVDALRDVEQSVSAPAPPRERGPIQEP